MWHEEQVAAIFGGVDLAGWAAWQLVHPTPAESEGLSCRGCDGCTSAWQRTHASEGARVPSAPPRACGSWQLVHVACSGTVADASAETPAWHPLHVAAALVGVWGVWHVVHAAWPALGCLPPWQLALWQLRVATLVAVWGSWQVMHASWGCALLPVWHLAQVARAAAFGVWGAWQLVHTWMAAEASGPPSAKAAASRSRAGSEADRKSVV